MCMISNDKHAAVKRRNSSLDDTTAHNWELCISVVWGQPTFSEADFQMRPSAMGKNV